MRLFIVSADKRLRLALLLLLDNQPGMVVIGMADRMQGLLAQVDASQPDVLLLDCEQANQPMEELFIQLHKLEGQPKIIILSIKADEEETIMAAGADYFIRKDAPPDELLPLLNAIRLSKTQRTIHKDDMEFNS